MKSQVTFHLESAISHLKAAAGKGQNDKEDNSTYGPGSHSEIADWIRHRSSCLHKADWSDMEEESNLLFHLARWFDGTFTDPEGPNENRRPV